MAHFLPPCFSPPVHQLLPHTDLFTLWKSCVKHRWAHQLQSLSAAAHKELGGLCGWIAGRHTENSGVLSALKGRKMATEWAGACDIFVDAKRAKAGPEWFTVQSHSLVSSCWNNQHWTAGITLLRFLGLDQGEWSANWPSFSNNVTGILTRSVHPSSLDFLITTGLQCYHQQAIQGHVQLKINVFLPKVIWTLICSCFKQNSPCSKTHAEQLTVCCEFY